MTDLGALAADLGYRAGWAAVRWAPERAARAVFDRAGNVAGRRSGGPDQLRRNLARVLGVEPAEVPDDLLADAMRSYARYWCEAFRLPAQDRATVAQTAVLPDADRARLDAALAPGKGVILALPHTGNWDTAGVWLVQHYGRFATVAERLKPETLFERFVAYRESLGFEIFPLSGGELPPFGLLADRLRAGGIVCLLGERDIARHGVPVTFFGERTRMPAGSARLAIETGAALLPAHHWFEEAPYSRMSLGEPIDVSGGIESATQALADAFAVNIAAHPADWHMLQPLWEADWTDRQRSRVERDGPPP
ncbi:phosphatidylinositol mannoside acyltransferase [Gordonia terrae]|uniref:Phosphatidylinositol mannoside acyltransferase n=2 Tax=Gordonia terrae TaxID=2055 RepID=A0AAD0KDL4_9ACTN|nr:phosphatidylinositol mannoside acyltransferase [Gordonia terrae]VTR10330.1 Phosphatidylinositol mannoside acyltransferase [Clostridioides difficile]ANY23385.1 phosphatidylinositol mannoside acyltransferase [Gordonia terrae]AWO84116.1 phosphatidylinositol mannoside acyltransferase [Gordonia terrae]VTS51175.1 Phosphatidylinositol mannoside acyltransferase [Gordonia terrae]GAB41998.1 putative acyltransferase [Gordonia terrae NBRC 100016]